MRDEEQQTVMMGVLRWRHDLRSDAGQQQQQRPNVDRSSTGHNNHAHAHPHTHTLPKLISQVSFSRAIGNPPRRTTRLKFALLLRLCSSPLEFERSRENSLGSTGINSRRCNLTPRLGLLLCLGLDTFGWASLTGLRGWLSFGLDTRGQSFYCRQMCNGEKETRGPLATVRTTSNCALK